MQALVLCPTRELADQVATEIRRLARAEENIKVVTVYGGVPSRNQIASLENGAVPAVDLDAAHLCGKPGAQARRGVRAGRVFSR